MSDSEEPEHKRKPIRVVEYPASEPHFEEFKAELEHTRRHPIASVILRLMLSFFVFLILAFFAISSVAPYGGDAGMIVLALLVTAYMLIWSLWPLGRLFMQIGRAHV